MSSISFSTKPRKRYYSYLSDGHIYSITAEKPSEKATGGNYWCCYFECTPYHKDDDGKTYLLYESVGGVYIPTTSTSYYKGNSYVYFTDSNHTTPIPHSGVYYSKNGKTSYAMPQDATKLPQTTYPTGGIVYYFDKLIANGDSYDTTNKKFTPKNVNATGAATSYGSIILDMIKSSISLNGFTTAVKAIPEYLTGPTPGAVFTISSISYSLPANYLVVYGGLFMEKLVAAMKELGESYVKKYSSDTITTTYQNVTIATTVAASGAPVGTVTSTPVSE